MPKKYSDLGYSLGVVADAPLTELKKIGDEPSIDSVDEDNTTSILYTGGLMSEV